MVIIIIITIIMVYYKIIALESELRNYLHIKTVNTCKNAHRAYTILLKKGFRNLGITIILV